MQALHEKINEEINAGHLQEAWAMVEKALDNDADNALLHYLKGKLYMKSGDWQQATNCFLHSEALDKESPAGEARKMLADIMNFYHKDLYNP